MEKFKRILKAAMSSPIFWIIFTLVALVLFISYFERYTQVGLNTTYKIF